MRILPLAIIHQNNIYRNYIISYNKGELSLYPFDTECEATRFISAIIIVANHNIVKYCNDLPKIEVGYNNISEIASFLYQHNLYIYNDEEPTLISADSSGYTIL